MALPTLAPAVQPVAQQLAVPEVDRSAPQQLQVQVDKEVAVRVKLDLQELLVLLAQ